MNTRALLLSLALAAAASVPAAKAQYGTMAPADFERQIIPNLYASTMLPRYMSNRGSHGSCTAKRHRSRLPGAKRRGVAAEPGGSVPVGAASPRFRARDRSCPEWDWSRRLPQGPGPGAARLVAALV